MEKEAGVMAGYQLDAIGTSLHNFTGHRKQACYELRKVHMGKCVQE